MYKTIDGNICAPRGFLAAGVCAEIRKNTKRPDLALIYSEKPAAAAGVFTLNQVKAAPVLLTQQHLKNGKLQAIVVNSGNANACTGPLGMEHAQQMAAASAAALQIGPDSVAVASTGVIGVPLPITKILPGIRIAAGKMGTDGDIAAAAIMTTDTFTKSIAIEMQIGGKPVRLGGIAKGSGMIHPNMATMLGFITTDAAITPAALQEALSQTNQTSFNMITVDGDCSTNDMVVLMANGMAENPEISSIKDPDGRIFSAGLAFVCTYLAKEIARDGEGATKLIEVQVKGAMNTEEAQWAARAVCRSPLVKTAVFGEDANWGRIASALGTSGAAVDTQRLTIDLGNHTLFHAGSPLEFDEVLLRGLLQQKTIVIKIDLGLGEAAAIAWGCDLTYDYVKINASYRS